MLKKTVLTLLVLIWSQVASANITQIASLEEVKEWFTSQSKQVVTFVGYSGTGYENEDEMLEIASNQLQELNPEKVIVNIGGTPEGIGKVYRLAKDKGFETTGIVSTQANVWEVPISEYVDRVFYVQDEAWGGYIERTTTLTPTSKAMVDVSDIMVAIGGGDVANAEMNSFRKIKSHEFSRNFPVDANHDKVINKLQKKGQIANDEDYKSKVVYDVYE